MQFFDHEELIMGPLFKTIETSKKINQNQRIYLKIICGHA